MSILLEYFILSPIFHTCFGSAVAQWLSAWLQTEGPRVRASLASLRCGLWARHSYPSLVLVQPRKTRPYITELKSNKQTNHTGLPGAVINESDCRSRGREFDPSQVPYFCGDLSNFYGHSLIPLIQEGVLSVTNESMYTKYWLTA